MSKIAILCDFDGTIAQDDVGNLLFSTFCNGDDPETIVQEWKEGLISSRECLEREAALVRASREDLAKFICRRKLDPYFKDFIDFTKRCGMEVVVVSDGLDHYIEKMLMRTGLGDLDFYSNLLEIKDDRFNVRFPHYDVRDCRDCGNCKTHHLDKFKGDGYTVIYVGNGLSDRCPSLYSDLVFAKGELLDFCRLNDVNHVEFRNFRDVEREMLRRYVLNGEFGADEGVGGL